MSTSRTAMAAKPRIKCISLILMSACGLLLLPAFVHEICEITSTFLVDGIWFCICHTSIGIGDEFI
jgi:hypothetical protein